MDKKLRKMLLALLCCVIAVSGCLVCVGCQDEETHTHSYVESITKEPGCAKTGTKTFTCSCGDSYTETIAATGHTYEVVKTIPATCLVAETEQVKCSVCNDETSRAKEGGQAALGHHWVDGDTIPATCEEAEKVHQTCDNEGCGKDRTVDKEGGQAAIGHDHVADESTRVEATCTAGGSVTYKCTHTGCEDYYEDYTDALGHTDDGTKAEVTEPTCSKEGYTTRHCSVCEQDYKSDNTAALGHSMEDAGTVAPSCASMGYDKSVCPDCGKEEHSNLVQNVAHSFNEEGVCTECGKKGDEAFALIASGTSVVRIEAAGKNAYRLDGNGSTVYLPYDVIEALVKSGVTEVSFDVGIPNIFDAPGSMIGIQVFFNDQNVYLANHGVGGFATIETKLPIAENGEVATSIPESGLKIAVWIGTNQAGDGDDTVDTMELRLNYHYAFNPNDQTRWLSIASSAEVTYDSFVWTFDKEAFTDYLETFSIPAEAISAWIGQGYTTASIKLNAKSGEGFDIHEGMWGIWYHWDLTLADYAEAGWSATSYLAPRNGFDSTTATGFIVTVTLQKPFDPNDQTGWIVAKDVAFDSVTYADNVWTFNKTITAIDSTGDLNAAFHIPAEAIAKWAEAGYSKAKITLAAKDGEYLELDPRWGITSTWNFLFANYAESGYDFTAFVAPRQEPGITGLTLTIELITSTLDVSDASTWVQTATATGVTYENFTWTFDRTIEEGVDYTETFSISAEVIAAWIADGYTTATIKWDPKEGEIFTHGSYPNWGINVSWTINLADYADEGWSGTSLMAARTAEGTYGTATGFVVTVVLA